MKANFLISFMVVTLSIILFVWILTSGQLSRFVKLTASCEISGLGTLEIDYTKSNVGDNVTATLNQKLITNIHSKENNGFLLLNGGNIFFRIDKNTNKIYVTRGNTSFSGTCSVKEFRM